MNVTKDKLESQHELVEHLQKELAKLQNIFNKENNLYRLMLDQHNAEQKLEQYKKEYLRK